MGKKTDKKLNHFFIVLGVFSVIITGLEGIIYYSAEAYPNLLVRCMLILQNTIKAFAFSSDIGLRDMSQLLENSKNVYEIIIGYAYTFAVFTAPYCTLAVMYRVLEKLFRFRSLFWRFSRKDRIIIFGYNNEVQALLNEKHANYRIHLVSDTVSKETEVELLKKKIRLHGVDFLKLSKNQLEHYMRWIESEKAKQIILFEDSSVKNFSLYQMFHEEKMQALLKEGVKFICRCEDEGIRRIIEDYHDSKGIEAKDLELVGIHELRAREVLMNHSLHEYWKDSGKPSKDWKLHLLIIGFGQLGQQILLQSMNLGVVSSENEILIDVVDFDAEKQKSIFANHFSDEYVNMQGDVFTIPETHANGKFTVRFHSMDIRYKKFGELLQQNGDPEKDGIYTYVTVCVEDMDISLHCMSELERYLHRNCEDNNKKKTSIGIRMEANRQMAKYLSENSNTYKNVFVIEGTESVVSLEDLLHDDISKDAKKFNYIYCMMDIKNTEEDLKKKEEEQTASNSKVKEEERARLVTEKWKSLQLFKRYSNLAVAMHEMVRNRLIDKYPGETVKTEAEKKLDAELEYCFGENGTLLQDRGNVWLYESDDALLDALENDSRYKTVLEYARMEHRRWCYFMASCGWKSISDPEYKKDISTKASSCMCTWEELATRATGGYPKYYTCKYDLMPLLVKYKKNKEE